jgi:sterol desaturase/sphingolipid hydroxylase (fatty acid hydroxylase superfamily)
LPAWLGVVVVTPATHRLHHERGGAVNLGPVLTVWDRAAGTWQSPSSVAAPRLARTWHR